MNNYEINYDGDNFSTITSVDGVELHEAHVIAVKEDLYSFISDASKDATGRRVRFNAYEMSIADLEAEADYYSKAAADECDRQEAEYVRAIAHFEMMINSVIENGAGDRETAIRWFRDANKDDMHGDDSARYHLGLPWNYDFDHGDREFFKRQAALAA
jgi:hypothetical protein